MRSQRNQWLSAMSQAEFAALDPWVFVNNPESRQQWVAEIRGRLRVAMADDEIHSILSIGLYESIASALRNHAHEPAERRGEILIGTALAFIRRKGVALVFDEIPGSTTISTSDSDLDSNVRRSHSLQDEYSETSTEYVETLEHSPVFLSDGVLLANADMQSQHRLIERIRCYLTTREHELLRLLVIDEQSPTDISEILELSTKQIGSIRRRLKLKLVDLALGAGVPADVVRKLETRTAE